MACSKNHLVEIERLIDSGESKMHEGDYEFASTCFILAENELKKVYHHLLLKNTCKGLTEIVDFHKSFYEAMEKYEMHWDIKRNYFSEIFSLTLNSCSYLCITPSSTFKPNQDGYIKIFEVDPHLQDDVYQFNVFPECIITVGDQLYLLSKTSTICHKMSKIFFTILTSCANGEIVVFTLNFLDDVDDDCLASFEDKLKTCSNFFEQSEGKEQVLYKLLAGVQLELCQKIKYTDASFEMSQAIDKTFVLKVGNKIIPLYNTMRYMKPYDRTILIKDTDLEVLIRFPTSVPQKEFMILEHIICEQYNFEDAEVIPPFMNLLQLINELDILEDEIVECSTNEIIQGYTYNSQFNQTTNSQASQENHLSTQCKIFQGNDETKVQRSISRPNKHLLTKLSESVDLSANFVTTKFCDHTKRILGLFTDFTTMKHLFQTCFEPDGIRKDYIT